MAVGDEYLFRLSRRDEEGQEEDCAGSSASRHAKAKGCSVSGGASPIEREILGLSPRTVNKHLEQVYAKLGVENRASAAIKAIRAQDTGF